MTLENLTKQFDSLTKEEKVKFVQSVISKWCKSDCFPSSMEMMSCCATLTNFRQKKSRQE